MRTKWSLKQLLGQMWLQGDTLSQTSHMHKNMTNVSVKQYLFHYTLQYI